MDDGKLSRRQLLALGGYGMVATTLPWVAGCGGGGGTKAAGPGGTGLEGDGVPAAGVPGAVVTAGQRMAALDAVAAAIAPAASAGLRFDGAALARRLQAMTAFQRVGLSPARQNVWALFTDGRALVVPNNLVPTGPTAPLAAVAAAPLVSSAAASVDQLPRLLTQGQYRQLDMFGQVPASSAVEAAHLCLDFVSGETLPRLRQLAVGRGFALPESQRVQPPDQGHDNGVAGLRSVSGDGVFFVTACSAEVGAGSARGNVICVQTPASEANEVLYQAELAAGTLAYAVTPVGAGGAWVPYRGLAITPAFASANWSFPPESLAILNLTGGSVLSDWGAVLSACGVRHVLTWDRPVSWQRMLGFADDLIQLLLATNNLDGTAVTLATAPRLRAYGVGETLSYLIGRHLTDDADGVNQAAYLQAFPPDFVNTLLPTIDYVNIDEARAVIELTGQFGARQPGPLGDAVVEARYGTSPPAAFDEPLLSRAADGPIPAGAALASPLWQGDLIQSATEPSALLGGGYLQVFNGGRWSNAVQITHWEIPMRVVTTITGGLTLDVTATLHLRADVRGHRMEPNGLRGNNRQVIPLQTTLQSSAIYEARGEITATEFGVNTTITWSGTGSVANALGAMRVLASGLLDFVARTLDFTLAVVTSETYDQHTVRRRIDPPELLQDDVIAKPVGVTAVLGANGLLPTLEFGPDWSLRPGSLELFAEPVDLLGPRTRTGALSWPAVTPAFPPSDTLGGV